MRGKWPARWEPQEEGVMNIAARFFPQWRNQGLIVLGEERQTNEGDADWLNSTPTRAPLNRFLLTHLWPVVTGNLHTTQPSTLFPTYDEVVNLTGLLKINGMSVSSGKQWKYASKVNNASKVNRWWQYDGNRIGVHSSLVVSLHKINNTCWVNKLQLGNW
jgi:hypothetical protein